MADVICSSTGNTVSMEYCKECALNVPPCGYDYTLIKQVHKSLIPRTGTHVTDLVHCLRRSWYEVLEPRPEHVSEVLYRVLGTAMHSIVEGMEDEHMIAEMPLEYHGIVGTVDAYYPEKKRLVDHKTSRWIKKANLPYGEHEMQVNIYRWMLEGNGYPVDRMYVHYIDMSGPTKCRKCKLPMIEDNGVIACPVCGTTYADAHHGAIMYPISVMDMDEIEKFVLDRKEKLEKAIETKEPPESDAGFLCNYCQFRDVCPDSQAR